MDNKNNNNIPLYHCLQRPDQELLPEDWQQRKEQGKRGQEDEQKPDQRKRDQEKQEEQAGEQEEQAGGQQGQAGKDQEAKDHMRKPQNQPEEHQRVALDPFTSQ